MAFRRALWPLWCPFWIRCFLFLYGVTFFVVLPWWCSDFRFSFYFQRHPEALLKRMTESNDERVSFYHQYINRNKNIFVSNETVKSTPLDIAITVITVSRNRHLSDNYKPQYLTQVVGRLMYLLKNEVPNFTRRLQLSICNVDADASSYYEAQSLGHHIHMVQRFDVPSLPLIDIVEKEKQDYVFCLNASLQFRPRYVLLLEDDALPRDGFYHALDFTLAHLVERRYYSGAPSDSREHISYIKLYHPEKTLGYFSGQLYHIMELPCIGAVLGMVLTCFINLMYFKRLKYQVPGWKIFLINFAYVVLVCIAIGRPHVLEVRRYLGDLGYTFHAAPECCTPAMMFPAEGARHVVELLSGVECRVGFGKDLALERLRQQHGLVAYLLQPNIVTHIGMHSSLSHNLVDPSIV